MQSTYAHALQKIASLVLCLTMLTTSGALAENLSVSNVSVNASPLQTQSASTNGMVRVYLSSLGNPSSLKLTIVGNYSLSNSSYLSNGESVTVGFNSASGRLTLTRNGSTLDMGQYFTLRRHSASVTNGIKIAQARQPSNPYPGDLSFQAVRQSSGSYKLYTIAHVYIEQYLYGVLPYEMGNSAHIEALMAQAVAARTYTVRMMASRASGLYDVVDTTNDQVYNGTPSGYANCVSAVDGTKGVVVMNGSSYTATYYSASNGGQTESIRNIWGSTGYDYLGVKDDPFDYANPNCTVKKATVYADCTSGSNNASLMSLLKSKVASALKTTVSNTTLKTIKSITPHTSKYAAPSRLYTKLDFALTATVNGAERTATVTCDIFNELESMLGMSIQSSSNELWTVEKSGNTFSIQARRFGHGMGMSQRGAMYMGKLGYTYAQILGFYYPGCTRVQKNFTNTILSADSDEEITVVEDPADIDDDSTGNAVVSLTGSNATLAIRASKSTTGKLLGTIANSSPVTVYANDGTWCFIRFGGIKGYVPTNALRLTGDVSDSDEDETPSDVLCFATVTANDFLNLRASGSSSAKIVSTAPTGSVLTVFSKDGSWAHIQFGATVAYASVDFLRFSDTYPGTVENTGKTTAIVMLDGGEGTVNLRASANTSSEILAKLPHGTEVQVSRDDGSWCMVVYQGMTGYIISDYLVYSDDDTSQKDDESDNDSDDEPTDGESATVAVSTAVLYEDQSEDAAALEEIAMGQSVVVTTRGDVWCAVRYDGQTGYMLTAHLRFSETTGETKTATVATQSGSLNMRQEARAGSPILTQIPRGATVTVTSVGSEWSAVRYGGYSGYVMTTFLQFSDGSTGEDEEQSPANSAVVTTISGSLNLRAQPKTGSTILRTIPRGATVAVNERGAEWSNVTYAGTTGYAMNAFLIFSEATADDAEDTPDEPSTDDDEAEEPSDDDGTLRAVVTTSSGSLNMRQSALPGSPIVARIPQGTEIPILEKLGTWSQTSYNGLTGYVMNAFLTFHGGTSTAPSTATAVVTTASGSLNLRDQPSGNVIGQIPRNETVSVIANGAAWCNVSYNGQSGYVMTSFLTFLAASAPPTEPSDDSNEEDNTSNASATVKTPSGTLNLRETASLSASVLAEIPRLTAVTVLEKRTDWCKVRYQEIVGYVQTVFLQFNNAQAQADDDEQETEQDNTSTQDDEQSASDEEAATAAWVLTPSGSLNLRESADANAAILAEIPRLASVTLLKDSGEWSKLRYGEVIGFAKTEYITLVKPSEEQSVDEEETEQSADENDAAQPVGEETPAEPRRKKLDPTLHKIESDIFATVVPLDDETTQSMHVECDIDSDVVCELASGERIQFVSIGDEWCEIRYGDSFGYCLSDALEWIVE